MLSLVLVEELVGGRVFVYLAKVGTEGYVMGSRVQLQCNDAEFAGGVPVSSLGGGGSEWT